ncbi:hypothetical protein [Paracoccus jiaweipingae]|uniref:hypothetical protein n=1 Tax=Paracoccus sp. p2-l61 TaxID=3366950 RepID=UPI0037980481
MRDTLRAQDKLEPVEDALDGLLDLLAGHDADYTIKSNGMFSLLQPIHRAVREANDILRQR